MEEGTNKLKLLVGITKTVAMGKHEYLAINLGSERLLMQYHTTLLLQVIVCPNIVITSKIVYLYSHIRKLRQLAQETGISTRHYILELIPEVEHVAKQIDGGSLVLYAVEKPNQPALVHAAVVNGKRAQMGIRKEIYILHPVPNS